MEINCQDGGKVKLSELQVIQGEFKDLSEENYEKLRRSIINEGFIAPFFIWNNGGEKCLLDGTQRFRVLKTMEERGEKIPSEFPCVEVFAKNKKEALRKILAISSQYGEVTKQGLYQLVTESEIDLNIIGGFRFPEIDLEDFKLEYFADPIPPKEKEKKKRKCPECGHEF